MSLRCKPHLVAAPVGKVKDFPVRRLQSLENSDALEQIPFDQLLAFLS